VIPITSTGVSVFTIPTDGPESDGTLEWTSTTIVVVEMEAGGVSGLGYTYGHKTIATLIADMLFPIVRDRDAMDVTGHWIAMTRAIRNQGRAGLASMAIAAGDAALWDLKARILKIPLVTVLGAATEALPVYGSGGFTSYSIATSASTGRLGRMRHLGRQDEGRTGAGGRPPSCPDGTRGDWAHR
jgi:L-alanine-DL-glutamate epimerase-like enolase superfamily enzyme